MHFFWENSLCSAKRILKRCVFDAWVELVEPVHFSLYSFDRGHLAGVTTAYLRMKLFQNWVIWFGLMFD